MAAGVDAVAREVEGADELLGGVVSDIGREAALLGAVAATVAGVAVAVMGRGQLTWPSGHWPVAASTVRQCVGVSWMVRVRHGPAPVSQPLQGLVDEGCVVVVDVDVAEVLAGSPIALSEALGLAGAAAEVAGGAECVPILVLRANVGAHMLHSGQFADALRPVRRSLSTWQYCLLGM